MTRRLAMRSRVPGRRTLRRQTHDAPPAEGVTGGAKRGVTRMDGVELNCRLNVAAEGTLEESGRRAGKSRCRTAGRVSMCCPIAALSSSRVTNLARNTILRVSMCCPITALSSSQGVCVTWGYLRHASKRRTANRVPLDSSRRRPSSGEGLRPNRAADRQRGILL